MAVVNETYLKQLFTAILDQSALFAGRLFLIRNASAMNLENFEQLMQDAIGKPTQGPKIYPCVLMLPLTEITPMNQKGFSEFIVNLVFVDNPQQTAQHIIKKPFSQMNVASDPFESTLASMENASHEFAFMLADVIKHYNMHQTVDYDTTWQENRQRVVFTGTDKVVGVVLTFKLRGWVKNCALTDYPSDAITNIQIPA